MAIASTGNYHDLGGLAELRGLAHGDQRAALEQAAKQFEGLFLQMMLKEMRSASFGDPLFDSNEGDMYRDMLDKQLSVSLSQDGQLGLAGLIVKQLQGQLGTQASGEQASGEPGDPFHLQSPGLPLASRLYRAPLQHTPQTAATAPGNTLLPSVRATTAETAVLPAASKQAAFGSPREFVAALLPHAQRAAEQLGVPARAIVAQAALETGWGQHMMQHADGRSSFNLFGIKADERWGGETIVVPTTEYRNGVVEQEFATFRSYASLAEAVQDYASFLKQSPRYHEALAANDSHGFAQGLQQAGYATDPGYAQKITGIISGDTLSEALAALNI